MLSLAGTTGLERISSSCLDLLALSLLRCILTSFTETESGSCILFDNGGWKFIILILKFKELVEQLSQPLMLNAKL